LPTVSGTCGNLTGGGLFDPAQAFSAFDGMAADGDWTLNLLDTDSSDTNTVSAWSLTICGLP
jgi:subtilisin-like proprotein convertase family protein